tara:strand:+ start:2986 stop:3390 length:405 start_codon:yes stop_codon:yes gene_type:complete
MDSNIILLPIYYTRVKKTKKNSTFLVGLNWYRNAHFTELSTVKNHYNDLIEKYISDWDFKINGRYGVIYKVYYKNPSCDAMNIISVIDKFAMDALQKLGITKEDNVKHYIKTFCDKPEQDRENPRIEILIKEIQ